MGDFISQEEIDALLSASGVDNEDSQNLTSDELDAIGEFGNINMGTSATTLSQVVDRRVNITTPQVSVLNLEDIIKQYSKEYVVVKIEYIEGLKGNSFLALKENDVKAITDLMMGGDGTNTEGEINDLHLSAICEVMNQMIGSSATSLSQMVGGTIDISPPKSIILSLESGEEFFGGLLRDRYVKVSFKMVIDNIVESEIMQLLPIGFSKALAEKMLMPQLSDKNEIKEDKSPSISNNETSNQNSRNTTNENTQQSSHQNNYKENEKQNYNDNRSRHMENSESSYGGNTREPINVQSATFQNFDDGKVYLEKKNVDVIMDIPLQVTVELGRTSKLIRDILEFGSGTIIELDKLAGEHVDILVNGKIIAKGEVVVIDESFGVRITEIIQPLMRI